MSAAHLIYVPFTLLVGLAVGYLMGVRAARAEAVRRKEVGADEDADV